MGAYCACVKLGLALCVEYMVGFRITVHWFAIAIPPHPYTCLDVGLFLSFKYHSYSLLFFAGYKS